MISSTDGTRVEEIFPYPKLTYFFKVSMASFEHEDNWRPTVTCQNFPTKRTNSTVQTMQFISMALEAWRKGCNCEVSVVQHRPKSYFGLFGCVTTWCCTRGPRLEPRASSEQRLKESIFYYNMYIKSFF